MGKYSVENREHVYIMTFPLHLSVISVLVRWVIDAWVNQTCHLWLDKMHWEQSGPDRNSKHMCDKLNKNSHRVLKKTWYLCSDSNCYRHVICIIRLRSVWLGIIRFIRWINSGLRQCVNVNYECVCTILCVCVCVFQTKKTELWITGLFNWLI